MSSYRIKIIGRTKHFIDVLGKELTVENAERALEKACRQTGNHLTEYTVAPILIQDRLRSRYEWVIEFDALPVSLEHSTEVPDTEFKKLNLDHEAKRHSSMTLNIPKVRQARTGFFHD